MNHTIPYNSQQSQLANEHRFSQLEARVKALESAHLRIGSPIPNTIRIGSPTILDVVPFQEGPR